MTVVPTTFESKIKIKNAPEDPYGVVVDNAGLTGNTTMTIPDGNFTVAKTSQLTPGGTGSEPANANIQSHISNVTTNPHAVTASQAGADAAGTAASAV